MGFSFLLFSLFIIDLQTLGFIWLLLIYDMLKISVNLYEVHLHQGSRHVLSVILLLTGDFMHIQFGKKLWSYKHFFLLIFALYNHAFNHILIDLLNWYTFCLFFLSDIVFSKPYVVRFMLLLLCLLKMDSIRSTLSLLLDCTRNVEKARWRRKDCQYWEIQTNPS